MRARLAIAGVIVAGGLLPAAALPVAPQVIGEVVWRVTPEVRRALDRLRVTPVNPSRRVRNWIGPRRQGSCVHATMVHLLHAQGAHDLARRWQRDHADGTTPGRLAEICRVEGIDYAETLQGDVQFLEWATRTRRGAGVVVDGGAHMVTLVALNDQQAELIDSNSPGRPLIVPRNQFVAEWKNAGGWAVTPLVGPPGPPQPWIVREVQK